MGDELRFCCKCVCCLFAFIVLCLSLGGLYTLLFLNHQCTLDPNPPQSVPYIARTRNNKSSILFNANLIFTNELLGGTDLFLPLDLMDVSETFISPHFYDFRMDFVCATIHVYPYLDKGYDLLIDHMVTNNGFEDRCVVKSLLPETERMRSCVSTRTGLTVAFLNVTSLEVRNKFNLNP